LLIWAAKGAHEIGAWGRATVRPLVRHGGVPAAPGDVLKWIATAAVLAVSLSAIPSVDQFKESRFPEYVAAGRWIASQSSEQTWVMDSGLQVPYYANGHL